MYQRLALLLVAAALVGCGPAADGTNGGGGDAPADTLALRIATYNLEDVRTADLRDPQQPRLRALAAQIQRVRPDVLLLNEIAYDAPGALDYAEGTQPGTNAQRFADAFLAVSQGAGLEPLSYRAFMRPSNTGVPSGFDLDNDGSVADVVPPVPPAGPQGEPGPQTPDGRRYGGDTWGFGTFPGQYAMAVLVRDDLDILTEDVRTFQLLRWQDMPGALAPIDSVTGESWYASEEWARMRLSSKSHWDVPVRLPGGTVIHVLASHPTPPAFDGPERRNVLRNHDEIRFWADYLDGDAYVVDDAGTGGGLPAGAHFVIMGDLNADPDEGTSFKNPIGSFLLNHARVQGSFVPLADATGQAEYPNLDPDDTAGWGLRVDYVLPSATMAIRDGGVARPPAAQEPRPTDHFMVWLDLGVPTQK